MRAASRVPQRRDPVDIVVPLARPLPDIIAFGAFLKNTVCVIHGARAYLSASCGDLDNAAAIHLFEDTVEDMLAATGAAPVAVVHDLHPDFHSTRYARDMGLPAVAVQHHHAHIAAIAAEHGVEGPLLGLALDGFGLGPGNQSWGGEMLLVDGPDYLRLGHLATLRQPGGDAAAREPWRMAAAALHRMGREAEIASRFRDRGSAAGLARIIERGINSPPTSSCGRLFDAACGLLGVIPVAEFEGQAPMKLEALVSRPRVMAGGWFIDDGVLDPLALLERLCDCPAADGADLFHGTLIAALSEWVGNAAAERKIGTIAMGGGCFLNRVLSDGIAKSLAGRGLTPLVAARVSPGDPGLSLGQAWVAAAARV